MPTYSPQSSVILHEDRSPPNFSQDVSPRRRHHGIVDGVPPANRLPNELLVEIFCYSQNHDHFLSWIKVTAVCSYWRGVALSTPKLWTKIDIGKAASLLHLFLERSRDASVDVFSFDALDTLQLLRHARNITAALVPNAHRIRSLHVPMIGDHMLRSLLSRTNVPMPRLEHLLLSDTHTNFSAGYKRIFTLLPFHYQPRLQSLHLEGYVFPWTSTMFSGLVSLTLLFCRDEENTPTIDTFLDFMETCPKLRYLRLSRTGLPEVPRTYSEPTRTVALPNLWSFSIVDYSITAAYVLEHLQLTPQTMLDLDLSFSSANGIPSLSRVLPRDGLPNFASVQSLYLTASSDYLQVKAYHVNGATCLSLKIDHYEDNTIALISSALTDIRTIFAASPVNSLSISGAYGSLRVVDWMRAMRAFSRLEYLDIGFIEGDIRSFFRALDPEISTEDATVPRFASLLWPQLRELGITGANVDETSLNAVVQSLRRRAARGNRLEMLGIIAAQEHRGLLEQKAEIIQTLVDEFQFDEADATLSTA